MMVDEDFEMALDLLRMSPVALPLLIMPSVSNPMMAIQAIARDGLRRQELYELENRLAAAV